MIPTQILLLSYDLATYEAATFCSYGWVHFDAPSLS